MEGSVALWLKICWFAFWRHLSSIEHKSRVYQTTSTWMKKGSQLFWEGAVQVLFSVRNFLQRVSALRNVVAERSTTPLFWVQVYSLPLSLLNKVQSPKISMTVSLYKQVVWWHSKLCWVFSVSPMTYSKTHHDSSGLLPPGMKTEDEQKIKTLPQRKFESVVKTSIIVLPLCFRPLSVIVSINLNLMWQIKPPNPRNKSFVIIFQRYF